MKLTLKLEEAKRKGIIPNDLVLPDDSLELFDFLLDLFRKKFNVEVMIQSGVVLDRGKLPEYQCIIGRQIDDFAHSQIFSSGMGATVSKAFESSVNEFIEYYGINKNDLLNKETKKLT